MRPALTERRWIQNLVVASTCAVSWSCARTPSRSEVARILERQATTPAGPRMLVTVDWKAAERSGIVTAKTKRIDGFFARSFEYYVAAEDVPLVSDVTLDANPARIAAAMMPRSLLGWPPEALGEKDAAHPQGTAAVVPSAVGVEVTGIRPEADNTRLAAEFTWTATLPETLAKCGCVKLVREQKAGKATLAKYDDGWRVAEVAW